jgi:hypothetical protein
MRSARLVMAAVLIAGLLGLLLLAVLQRTSLGFTLGVVSSGPVAALERGSEACQRPIDVPDGGSFNRLAFVVGTFYRPHGPRLTVSVKDLGGAVLARGDVAAGYPDITAQPIHHVALDRTVAARRISVCIANRGRHRVALYGNAGAAARTSGTVLDGKPLPVDLDLKFERGDRLLADLAPLVFKRAALFGFPWEGKWLYILLGLALLLGGPWLLWRAIASAGPPDREPLT